MTKFAFFPTYFALLLCLINLSTLLFQLTHFALSFTNFTYFAYCGVGTIISKSNEQGCIAT